MDDVLVVCPRCGGCAVVSKLPDERTSWRVLCPACAYVNVVENRGWKKTTANRDVFFHPLWLRTVCAHGEVYAYNRPHLAWLESYVEAMLRKSSQEHGLGWSNRSAANRLPAWIKSGKNRTTVLHAIARLKRKAPP